MTTSDAHSPLYGGDAAGLICGYLLGDGMPVQAIDSAQAAEWLKAYPRPGDRSGPGRRGPPA